MLRSYGVVKFRHPHLVLQRVSELLSKYLSDSFDELKTRGSDASGELSLMHEFVENLAVEMTDAPKTTDIIPAAPEPLRVDTRNYRSRERDGRGPSGSGPSV